MLFVSAGVIFFLLVLTGIGLLFAFKRDQPAHGLNNLLRSFWVGLAITIAALQIWHLFFPVGLASFLCLLAASLVGWVRHARQIWAWLRRLSPRRVLLSLVLGGMVLVMLSNQAIWGELHFDHGLYHLQTVKWLQSYAIVPGLGNLHHRLAFNNASLLYAAQLNTSIFKGMAVYMATTLPCFVVALRCFSAVDRLLQDDQPLAISDLYYCLLLPFLVYFIAFSTFSGYSPDSIVAVLQMVIGAELISLIQARTAAPGELIQRVTLLILLCALLITVKLSAVVFAGLVILAGLLVYLRRGHGWKPVLRWAACFGGLVLPWLVRSVILSGYLLFPSTLISFPVQWKMPASIVTPIAATIHNWATYDQATDPQVSAWEWFTSWWNVMPFEMKEGAVYLLLLLGLLLAARLLMKNRQWQWEWQAPLALVGVCLCSILYWALLAPDVRFLGMAFWLVWVAALLLVCQAILAMKWLKSANLLVAVMIMAVLFWLAPAFNNNISIRSLLMPPSEALINQKAVENNPPGIKVTKSGLTVYLSGVQACWDDPLPCAPANDFNSRLTLIDPADMGKGFYIQER